MNNFTPNHKKSWKPKEGEWYYYVETGFTAFRVHNHVWKGKEGDQIDNHLYKVGNCYKTQAQAQVVADKIYAMFKPAD